MLTHLYSEKYSNSMLDLLKSEVIFIFNGDRKTVISIKET